MLKYKYFATVKNGKVTATSDASNPREPLENEIPLDQSELIILRTFSGHLDIARKCINDLDKRIAASPQKD